MFKPVLASLLLVGAMPAAGELTFTEDFTGFMNNVSSFQAGGDQGQVITTSVGTSQGTSQGAPTAIDGTSLFTTIDTTAVDPVGSGSYGGGIQTDITDAFAAGDLTSSDPADYNVILDVAANGFAPNNVDIFLQFRNQFNDNQLGAQLSINQNNAVLAPFITQLGASNDAVSISIPLSEFSGTPADVSGLLTSDRIQFQYFTRSLDANYSADAGNVLVIDNVGVSLNATAIPEPASTGLLAVGAFCLMARRRFSA